MISSFRNAAAGGLAAAGFTTLGTLPASAQSAVFSAPLVGSIGFAAPWVLAGLATLPVLWWLMRSVPPKPQQHDFPAIRFLFNLKAEDQEPARMPWWQRQLRLAAAALAIIAFAQPQLNPDQPFKGNGPVMLVVDNDWSAAKNWDARKREIERLIDKAEQDGRKIILMTTAAPEDGGPFKITEALSAEEARRFALGISPQPWSANRAAVLDALGKDTGAGASVIWLSNGLEDAASAQFARRIGEGSAAVRVVQDDPRSAAKLLLMPEIGTDSVKVTVRRTRPGEEEKVTVIAADEKGLALGLTEVVFTRDKREAVASIDIPQELRNQLARLSIEGENTAGSVVLLDERWRRRPVGLLNSSTAEQAQPLLSESGYVEKAIGPFSDFSKGNIEELLARQLSVMVLTDSAAVDSETQKKIDRWVKEGGTLLRFAGPRLAAREDKNADPLLPLRLRSGERVLGGGTLASGKIGKVAPFAQGSPFFGLAVPEGVSIHRDVLADPGFDPELQTWAQLEDGTPLVSAKRSGEGWLVLVHTTANTKWSNLPLSGFFIDMLRAVVAHSQGASAGFGNSKALPPLKTLDSSGRLSVPSAAARALTAKAAQDGAVGPASPPGFYGTQDTRYAHNLAPAAGNLDPLVTLPASATQMTYEQAGKKSDMTGYLLGGALSLLLVDILALMAQRGLLRLPSTGGASSGSAGRSRGKPRTATPGGA